MFHLQIFMNMRLLSTFFFAIILFNSAFAQKVMKLDTPKDPSRMSFLIGSNITFQTDGDDKKNKIWMTKRIVDFDIDRHQVIFDDWSVTVEDIIAVRKGNERRIVRTIGATLMTFGALNLRLPAWRNLSSALFPPAP